jgi:hypothetical protein
MSQQQVLDYVAFFEQKDKDSDVLVSVNREHVREQFETQMELMNIGASIQSAAISDNDRKKKDKGREETEAQKRAEMRIRDKKENTEKIREAQSALQQNDRYRKQRVEQSDERMNQVRVQSEQFERKGDTQRTENAMKTQLVREKQQSVGDSGEQRRKQKASQVEFTIKENYTRGQDERKGADQRITNTQLKIDQKKDEAEAFTEGKGIAARENAMEIERQKRDNEFADLERENKSSNERYEARKKAYEKSVGEPRDEEAYKAVSGTENLKQGVTENSYKLGNKMVTERLVKIGKKVDKYKKVVSKTAIYFFRNGQSITEETWKQGTLEEPD